MADDVARFFIKSRAGIKFNSKRKHNILHTRLSYVVMEE
jgi:hypothetical protein